MKAINLKITLAMVLAGLLAVTSCIQNLDTEPIDDDVITSASVYKDPANYRKVLAKLYAGMAVTGQQGPHGMGDISGLDEGFGQYLRLYWYAQELPTEEAIISWNDGNLRDFQEIDWSASNEFLTALYYRIYYQIALCNEFIRESSDAKLDERGISSAMKAEIQTYRAEARFLRALSYWHALDLFGSVPFVTEDDPVGSTSPEQITKQGLFDYIESELLAIENELVEPLQNEYARADQAAAWMLLAKLYLNAEVYTGTEKYTECITYLNNVIDAGYMLDPVYSWLFCADNNTSWEIIFPIAFDGQSTQTWGGTTFIVHAAVGGTMDPAAFGIDGGWGGLRTMKTFVAKFMNVDNLKAGAISLKSAVDYPVLYVPGGHNGWNPANDTTVLASVNSDNRFEGYLYFSAGNLFKFCVNPDWSVNYGDDGADGILDADGANITVAEDGYYKINVNLNNLSYNVVKTDWGVIGDATADGWDADQNMTWVPDSGYWQAILELNAGTIKFRANDAWDLDYGDNGADGILDRGGANIAVSAPGNYMIRMKLGIPDYTYSVEPYANDGRKLFWTDGQSIDIDDMFEFTQGYAVTKWSNVTAFGIPGSNSTHCDTDFPLFRLADAYLMYAEAVLRGGSGGSADDALTYVNAIRERAYGDNSADIAAEDLTLDFIIDERARELFWECHRRTDLVRFDLLTSPDYKWQWKGGIKDGKGVDSKFNSYPLPDADLGANTNLKQNPDYN